MGKLACIVVLLAALAEATAMASTELATNARGDQVLLRSVLGQQTRPLYAGTRAPGGRFSPLVQITSLGAPFTAVAGVDDAGGAVAGTMAESSQGYISGTALLTERAPGAPFESAVDFSPHESGEMLLAVNGRGDAISILRGYTFAGLYRFRPAGGEFGPLTRLPESYPRFGAVTMDSDGTAVFVWVDDGGLFEASRPPGGEFGPPTRIADPHTSLFRFASARTGRAILVWAEDHTLKAVERQPGGHFGAPFDVATSTSLFPPNLRDVAIAPSGAAAITFDDRPSMLTVRDPGSSFEPPRRVAGFPARAVVDDRGDVAVAWFGNRRRLHAAYRPAGRSLGKSRALGPPWPFASLTLDLPSLVIEDTGRATAAWEWSDAATVRTFTRDFDGSGVRARVEIDRRPSFVREGPRGACRPEGVTVIRSSRRSTVFNSDRLLGCLLARGVPVTLPPTYRGEVQTRSITLAGPLVAYAYDDSDARTSRTSLSVTDLRDPASGVNRFTYLVDSDTPGFVAAIRLKPNGAVAWIDCLIRDSDSDTEDECARGRMSKRLIAWDAGGKSRVLDSGPGIRPRSFRLRGSRLTWRHGRKLRHARLR